MKHNVQLSNELHDSLGYDTYDTESIIRSTLGKGDFFKSQVHAVYIQFKAIYALKFVVKEMSVNFCVINS